MTGVVVDASVALAWCFPDKASSYAEEVLIALEGQSILVPAVWGLEIANALLAGERSRRLGQPEIRRFISLLQNLSWTEDFQPVDSYVSKVLPVARQYTLSAYDAAYLELAIRRRARLATLDGKLHRAAQTAGIEIFDGD